MPANAGILWYLAYAVVMRGGWVYMMTNKPRGVLYVGVTANLAARIDQHRSDRGSVFCRRYGLKTLVLTERFDTIEEAISREKQIKAWRRDWKVDLIGAANPTWSDLFNAIA